MPRNTNPGPAEHAHICARSDIDRLALLAYKKDCKERGVPVRQGLLELVRAYLNSKITELGS